jgi:hypothetical protein
MATPQNPAAQPGSPSAAPTPEAKKPTLWIVLAAVAALAAIGFAIWGFSTKSDLDTANAKIAKQDTRLAKQHASIAAAGANAKTAEKIEQAQIAEYQHTRRVLSRTKNTVAQQRVRIAKEKEDVRAAQQQVDEAGTREAKLQANLNLVQQQLDVAQACSKGTISAIDSAFAAPTAKAGINRLNAELAALSKDCDENIGATT